MATSTPHQEASKSGSVTNYEPKPFGSLKYPTDLSTGRDGSNTPDAVCFTIMKRIGMSLDAVTAAASKTWKGVNQSITAGFGTKGENIGLVMSPQDKTAIDEIMKRDISDENKRQQITARVKQVADAKNISLSDTFFDVTIGAVNTFTGSLGDDQRDVRRKKEKRRKMNVRGGGEDILGSIYMNMPGGVQFNDKANWGGQELGMIGNTVKNVITGGGGNAEGTKGAVVGAAGQVAAAGVAGIGALVAKMGLKGGLVGMAVGAAAAGSTIQKGGEAAMGISMNPYMEMMFSGVSFRDFQFDFVMRPRSADEFTEIDKIIKMFREHSRPSWVGGLLGKSFMNYPMVYRIEFLTTTGTGDAESYAQNNNVPKLKTCVCDSVSTNYAPQNMWTAHQRGVPVAITLNLHFQETELVMAQDVQQGGF